MHTEFIGQQLKQLREANGIAVRELVAGVISEQQYYRIVKDESAISTAALIIMLDRLNISVDTFLKRIRQVPQNQHVTMNVLDLIDRTFWTKKDASYFLEHFRGVDVDTNKALLHNFVQHYRTELAFETDNWNVLIDLMTKMLIYALENNCDALITEIISLKGSYYVDELYPTNVQVTQMIKNHIELRAGRRTITAEITWAKEIVEYAKHVEVDVMIENSFSYVKALQNTTLYS